MIERLRPYPRLKDSGVDWLQEIPAHWDVRRIKSLSAVKRGASPRPIADPKFFDECGEYAWVRISDVTASNKYLESTTQRLSGLGRSFSVSLQPGSLFLSIAGSVGKPIIAKIKCCIHDGFVYFPDFIGNVDFLYHTLSCDAPFANLGKFGTQLNLNTDTVGNIVIGWPTVAEQTAIARFLDYMDRRIQKYIRAKEKLIVLLDDYKQALIHQAVTGQIDVRTDKPYPEYKKSGVEWFGDVPIEWDLVALRHLGTKFGSGVTPRGGSAIYTDKGVAFLRSQNIHFDGLRLGSVARIPMEIHESLSGTHVKNDDVLLNITGASIGRVTWVPKGFEDANVNQHVCIIRPKRNRILPEFLAAFLSTPVVQNEIQVEQSGASREGLTLDSIRSIKVALPSVFLQKQIVGAVQRIRKQITNVTDSTMEEVKLLNEYRTRLIADVVTGKLDVREAAAGLPDTNAAAWEGGVDTIQSVSHSHRAENRIVEEANA